MSKVLRVFDAMSGVVLLLMVVLAPWILGATTRETIWALNGLGFCRVGCGSLNGSSDQGPVRVVSLGRIREPDGRWLASGVW
jgi:hypothetical protein